MTKVPSINNDYIISSSIFSISQISHTPTVANPFAISQPELIFSIVLLLCREYGP